MTRHYSFWGVSPGRVCGPSLYSHRRQPAEHLQTGQQMFDTAVCLAYTFVIRVICPAGAFNPGKKNN
jgi:hypothetical protein